MFNSQLRSVLVKLDSIWTQLGADRRTGSRTVPLHKFNRLMDIGTNDSAVGVCLWGPPGCGKSSAMSHIMDILQVEELIYVNSDDWVEFLASSYFSKSYETNCKEKHELYRTRASPVVIDAFLKRELDFKEKIRSLSLSQFGAFADEQNEDKRVLPATLYELMNRYFLAKFKHTVTLTEWDSFQEEYSALFVKEPNPGFLLYDIVPWWAKLNSKPFVLETTGRSFNVAFHRGSFADIPNIMYIPFVSDLDALKQRVHSREAQFGNPDAEFVETVFKNAYGANLVKVLDSGIYDQIVVQGNNRKNYVMVSLEKIEQDAANRFNYILVKEFADDLNEALYIKRLLEILYIPEELQAQNQLVYDTDTKQWSVGASQE
jgi:hypothetical protein